MNEDGTPQSGGMVSKQQGQSQSNDDIIAEVKHRFELSTTADSDNHKEALDDLEFLKGNQWPEKQRRSREADGRPCLTVNKLPTFLQQVTNDQRQNRANIKVSPTSVTATAKTAELLQGMIKHIEYDSSADAAYDTAVNSAAAIGFGYFRLVTDYCSPTSFDQEIRFKRIRNPFTVYFDPASTEPDGSDSQWVLITEKMTKTEFQAKYPDATVTIAGFAVNAPGDSQRQHWVWQDMVRIAEYYRIEFTPATLYLLGDGTTTTEKPPAGVVVAKTRPTVLKKVMWRLVTPYEVIEEVEIKCQWIPVFPVYGTEIDIDGKIYRAGLVRNAKDPAMMYNFWMTSATEEVSLRPKTPFIGAEGAFEGHEKKWLQANNRSFPYLEYKPTSVDGQLAPPPSRQPMADVPVGVLAMASHASDNIKQTTGLFDSSLGAAGNATSGKQEIAQQKQGNVANFHYMDNFIRTLRHAGKCIVSMVPHYYDTTRLVKARGEDGTVSQHTINQYDEAAQKIINDLSVGEYDVAVTPGPSYATMRAEAADAMVQFGQSWPKLMDIAGDQVVKAMNWPGAEEIAERIARTIPDNIKNDPEDGPAPISPEAQQQIDQLKQQLEKATHEADKNNAGIEKARVAAEAAVEAAHINAESRKDVEELSGMVKLLLAKMPVPPELSQDVAADLAQPDPQSSQQVPQMSAPPPVDPGMPMNGDPQMMPNN